MLILMLLFSCAPTVTFQQLKPARFKLDREIVLVLGKAQLDVDTNVSEKEERHLVRQVLAAVNEYIKPEAAQVDMESNVISSIAGNPFARYSVEEATYTLNLSGKFSAHEFIDARDPYQIRRTYNLDLAYDVVSLVNGRTVIKDQYRTRSEDFKTGKTRDEAINGFQDWADICRGMTGKAVEIIIKAILPHYETAVRTLKKGSSDKVNEAVKKAEQGELDRAGEMWLAMLPQIDSMSAKDRMAVYHNLGIYYESHDQLEESSEAFSACMMTGEDKLCTYGLNRVKGRLSELVRLRQSSL